jgi:hypothetical protein
MCFVIVSFFRITFSQISKELNIGNISQSMMNMLRHHLNVDVNKEGFVFAKCVMCESLKDLISKLGRNNNDARKYELKLRKHLLHQESCISLYHTWRSKFVWSKDEFLCVIIDKMGSSDNCTPKVVGGGEQNDL